MNKLLMHFLILIGRRKFEDFAQANPQLPNDTLAVANTLDTYPAKAATTIILGSLAHVADEVLKGSVTVESALAHVVVILGALCVIWVRHAVSKNEVGVNAALQKAREVSGIKPTGGTP